MTTPCRPNPTRPRTEPGDRRREDCTHPAQWHQPGGLCGRCGWDEFGVAGAVDEVHNEIEEMEGVK